MKDMTTANVDVFYAIVEKASGKVLATNGKPRLWLGLKGPAQLLGKGIKEKRETDTHRLIQVRLVEDA